MQPNTFVFECMNKKTPQTEGRTAPVVLLATYLMDAFALLANQVRVEEELGSSELCPTDLRRGWRRGRTSTDGHTRSHIHVNVCVYTYMYMYINEHTCTCTHTYMYVLYIVCTYIHMYTCTVRTYVQYMYICTVRTVHMYSIVLYMYVHMLSLL